MADKERIYRIKFEGLESQVQNLANLKKSVDDLKTAKKALDKSTEEGRIADEKLTLEIKNLNKQYQEQQKEVEKMDKLNQKQGDTLEKMRAKLSLMRKELEGMQVGSKAFNDQTKAVEALQSKINLADEATGRFNGNVGNYKGSIISAFQQMGINMTGVTEAINTAKVAMVGMEVATNKGAFAMKILKIAIASTGIGILIVAIGTLISYFQSAGDRADKFLKIIAPFKEVFNQIQKAVFGFIDSISVAFDWLAKITGLIGTEQQKLIEQQDQYDDAKRASIVENAKMERERAELLFELAQRNKYNEEQRIELAKKVLQIDEDMFNKKVELAKQELENTKKQYELENNMSDEALIDVENKTAELENLKTEQYMRGVKMQSRMAALLVQETNDETKKTDAIIANAEKEKKAKEDLAKFTEDLMTQADALMFQTIEKIDKALNDLEKKRKDAEVAFNEFNEGFEKPQEQEIQDEEDLTLALNDIWKKRADLEKQLQENSWQLTKDGIRDLVDYKVLTESEGERLIIENRMASYQLTAQMAGQAATLFKKNTVAYKALAISEAVINTVLGMIRALKDFPAPLSYVMMALTGAMGTAATMKIANVKLAKGGIVGGQLHEHGGTVYRGSDGQSFEAERGELIAVVNRHDTERLKALSAANSVYGRPFFAAGGMIQPNTEFLNQDLSRVMAETVSQIASIPVVVSERDITRSQRRVSVIENAGNL